MFKKRTFLLGFQWYSKYFKSNDKLSINFLYSWIYINSIYTLENLCDIPLQRSELAKKNTIRTSILNRENFQEEL